MAGLPVSTYNEVRTSLQVNFEVRTSNVDLLSILLNNSTQEQKGESLR